MANPEQKQYSLFTSLISGREGGQCAFSARALSYIFHGWAHYKGQRKQLYGKPDNGVLNSIPFEKLALFWCRLWGELWRLDGMREQRNGEPVTSSDQTRISCQPPFTIERAKHGKRVQRYNGVDDPTPLIDILYNQQELGMRGLFEIRPFSVDGRAYPSHYKTEVHASMPYEVRDSLISTSRFTETDRRLIEEIDEITRHLGVAEIRALGTHENLQETMRDIELEYDKMNPLLSRVSSLLEEGRPFLAEAEDSLEYAEEAYRKSYTNRAEYISAYDRFLSDLKNPLLQQAFTNCQEPAAAIWNSSQVEALASRSEQALGTTSCLTAIAYFCTNAQERRQARSAKAREMEHHWREGIQALIKYKMLTISSNLSDLYDGDGPNLKVDVIRRLVELISRVQV